MVTKATIPHLKQYSAVPFTKEPMHIIIIMHNYTCLCVMIVNSVIRRALGSCLDQAQI